MVKSIDEFVNNNIFGFFVVNFICWLKDEIHTLIGIENLLIIVNYIINYNNNL